MERLYQQIRQAQGGDAQAMIALLERFEPLVQAAVAARMPRRQEREDLLQEAYVALLRAIREYDHGEVSFPYFAKRLVYGATWSALRRHLRKRERERPEETSNSDGEPLHLLERIADEGAEAAFSRAELESCFTSLSPRERLVMDEVVFGGMRMRELAQREGVSADTVKVWKKRALAKIRQALQERED